ncbi:MAG TPA: PLP-dependent aminotransferase family protein [Rhizomicrobium sp.]|nr:PLP-dependent aminotransferase family protein [Rhizomicrobium sp.]
MDWTPTLDAWPGPIYQRIVEALASDIANGHLARGQQLPTHRALAAALKVDLTTASRAYREARKRGLLEAQVGRGTFVAETTVRAPAHMAGQVKTDFSMNVPPHPVEANFDARIAHGLAELQRDFGLTAFLNYQQPGGNEADLETAAHWLAPRVPGLTADRLVIYPGTQPALFNLLLTLTRPGDTVLTEALTYPGFRAAADQLGLNIVGVEMDSQGIVPDALARACAVHKPKLAYLVPTIHNPSAATIGAERRRAVAKVLRAAATNLIEDDAYGGLDPTQNAITNLIPERSHLVIGLSKSLAPAFRVSFVIAPDHAARLRMVTALQATALMPPPLMVALMLHWIKTGVADQIVSAVRAESAGRQILARKSLGAAAFSAHPGGHHLWLHLPRSWSRAGFTAQALDGGVAIVPSDVFCVTQDAPHAVRVSLGAPRTRAELVQGLNVLATALRNPPGTVQIV